MAIVSKKRNNNNRSKNRNKRLRSRRNKNKSKYLFSKKQRGGSETGSQNIDHAILEYLKVRRTLKISFVQNNINYKGIDIFFDYINNLTEISKNTKYLILQLLQHFKKLSKIFSVIEDHCYNNTINTKNTTDLLDLLITELNNISNLCISKEYTNDFFVIYILCSELLEKDLNNDEITNQHLRLQKYTNLNPEAKIANPTLSFNFPTLSFNLNNEQYLLEPSYIFSQTSIISDEDITQSLKNFISKTIISRFFQIMSRINLSIKEIIKRKGNHNFLHSPDFETAVNNASSELKKILENYNINDLNSKKKLELYDSEQFDFVIDGKTSKFIRYIPGERKKERKWSSTSSISSTASIDYKKTKHFISKVVTNNCNLYIICVNCLGDIYIFLFELNKVKRRSGTSLSASEHCETRKSTDIFDDKTHDKIKKIFRLDNTKLYLFENISIDLDVTASTASTDRFNDNINPEQNNQSFCDKVDFTPGTAHNNPSLSLCTSSEIVLKQEDDKIIQKADIKHCMLNYFKFEDKVTGNTLFFRKTPNIYYIITTNIKNINNFMKKMLLTNFSDYEFLIWEEKETVSASLTPEPRINLHINRGPQCGSELPVDKQNFCNNNENNTSYGSEDQDTYIDYNALIGLLEYQTAQKKYRIKPEEDQSTDEQSPSSESDVVGYVIPSKTSKELVFCKGNPKVEGNEDPIAIYRKQMCDDLECTYKDEAKAPNFIGLASTEASGGARTKRNNRRLNKNKFNTKRRQKKMKRFNQSRKRNRINTRNKLSRKSNKNK